MAPLPNERELPAFKSLNLEEAGMRLEQLLAAQQNLVDRLVETGPVEFARVWDPLEQAGLAVSRQWSVLPHLEAVLGTPPIRKSVAENQPKIVEAGVRISHNRGLYDLYRKVASAPGHQHLSEEDRIALDRAIEDFEHSGVLLEDSRRDRLVQVRMRLAELSREFSNAVVDSTDAWSELVTCEADLEGIPDTDKRMLAEAAKARNLSGWLITLRPESAGAILTFADDRTVRRRVWEALSTRASELGPDAGKFDNNARIREIVQLRREMAKLLGFAHPVELALTRRMASDFAQVLAFLSELAARARPAAEAQYGELLAFGRDDLGLESLEVWDIGYVTEKLRRRRFDLDDNEVKKYFPLATVQDGWRALLLRLYGLELRQRPEVDVWHPDVMYYEVVDAGGATIGGIYADLHAREGKRGGAWMNVAMPRRKDQEPGLPVTYLVCNFAPPDETGIALLSHRDIQTLLHETGHCLHQLLTEVDRISLSGLNGVEWDAIEVPSQIMEDFAWDWQVLQKMSAHRETQERLPGQLYERLCEARTFGGALRLLRQVEFALYDLRLHGPETGLDHLRLLEDVRKDVAVIKPPSEDRFACTFSHIFAGGYAAGYYSYLWAENLAADGFQAFAEDGTLSRRVGERFRKEVLSRGGVRSAATNFRAFRGRSAEIEAMLARYGLSESASSLPVGSGSRRPEPAVR